MRHVIFFSLLTTLTAFGLAPGAAAPDFKLSATDGKSYDLKEALKANGAAMVVFIATKCPYSNAYNERYNQLITSLKGLAKPVAFFAINSNDTEPMADVKKHAEERKFAFPVLKDEKHATADAFGAEKTPEAFLIGTDGKVFYHGRIDDDTEGKKITRRDVLVALEEHFGGRKVSQPETKAFGCSIKRK